MGSRTIILSDKAAAFMNTPAPILPFVEDIYSIGGSSSQRVWITLVTSPRSEEKVGKKLSEKRIEEFVPIERIWKTRIIRQESKIAGIVIKHREKTERKPVDRPMIPGYAFARVPLVDGMVPAEAVARVLDTDGVHRILGSATTGFALPIPDAFIAFLRRQQTKQGVIDRTKATRHLFKEGTRARVTDGPFAGFLTTIKRCLPDDIYETAVNLLGKSHDVKFELAQLEKVW